MRSLNRGASALIRSGATARTDRPAGGSHVRRIAGAAITAMLAATLVPGTLPPASADVGGSSIVTSPGAAKGFPEFFDDGSVKLRLCTKGPQCMVVGSIPEYFWYGATAVGGGPQDPNNNLKVYLAGIEGTYFNFSISNPPPKFPTVVPGDEVGFNRLRFRVTNLVVGATYKITHPYGVNTFVATNKGGVGEINRTFDIGCVAALPVDMRPCDWNLVSANFMGDHTQGRTAFLRQANAQPGYLGDILVPGPVTGAPSGVNAVIVEGPNAGGPGIDKLTVTNFAVQGQILPGTPSTPDLVSASDTGSSSTDNITNATQPTFAGTTDGFVPGNEVPVNLWVDGAPVAAASTTTVNGKYSVALPTQAAGQHSVVADSTGLKSSPLVFTVDTVAPAVSTHIPTASAVSVSQAGDVTASFTENVTGVSGATFTLRETATDVAVGAAVNYDATTWAATLNPTATLAPATGYTATLTAGLTDAAGNPMATTSWTFTTTVAPPATPSPPTVTAGDAQVALSWTAPADGGSPVTGYAVTASPGGGSVTMTGATTATVTGLTNGTAYTFTVKATNAAGTSADSAPSAAVTPRMAPSTTPTPPSPPASVTPVQRYIGRVYSDLFNRAPDPAGLTGWTDKLNGGTPRITVANAITYSAEYRSKLIAGSYDRYLSRTPDPSGLSGWLGAMGRGWTVSRMESGFIASNEYFGKAGNTNSGWVTKLYKDVLGRAASPAEVSGWTAQLRRGVPRSKVAMGFLLSTERLGTVVDGHYRHLLGRGLDPSGRRSWVKILGAGGRDEAIIGGIIASAEYLGRP